MKAKETAYKIGKAYLIRTVTMYYLGKLIAVTDQELVITHAVWVADTGRFHHAVTTGELAEVEPFCPGEVIIGRGGVIDASLWTHPIPTTPK